MNSTADPPNLLLEGAKWMEVLVFVVMLGASALIGVFYGCIRKSDGTVSDYMLGGKRMSLLPVSMSLVVSQISGITLLGFPAEIFDYGTQICGQAISVIIVSVIIFNFYLPVLYEFGGTSIFEYLEIRFDKRIRRFASFLFTLKLLLYIPLVIYVPSLAFHQVTDISLLYIAPAICTVCIFYTTLGGLKAVVWSDALQSIFTVSSMIVVFHLGLKDVGGISEVLKVSEEGNRLEFFNMDPDPFQRNTFWTVIFGSTFIWLALIGVHPSFYQRYSSLSSYFHAKMSIIILCIGIVFIKVIASLTGLVIYAMYHDCNPVLTKEIGKTGEILPYYVSKVSHGYHGLVGLFLSGVASTALSTMSSGLNTVAGTIFEDFVRPYISWTPSEKQTNLIIKITVLVIGFLSMLLIYMVHHMGEIMHAAITLSSVATGASLFLFTFGMFVPFANSKGALTGALSALVTTTWIVFGAQKAIKEGLMKFPGKLTSIEGCPENYTLPIGLNQTRYGFEGYGGQIIAEDSVFQLYKISIMYYCATGFLIGLIVGIPISLLTGPTKMKDLNPKLLIPQLRRFCPQDKPCNYGMAPIKR